MTPAERGLALLTTAEMARADAAAVAAGIAAVDLMEAAGRAVADACRGRWCRQPVTVLCGPGNNGGDGFVAARILADWGWPVRLALPVPRDHLKGEAAYHAARWTGPIEALTPAALDGVSLVIDAIFGAGLKGPLTGAIRDTIEAVAGRRLAVLAVDVPSGVHGDDGSVMGTAAPAELTVTFFRKKPGHLLLPGRAVCGRVQVVGIGIPEETLELIGPTTFENAPALWIGALPRPRPGDHKYRRGHAVIVGGSRITGAARLAGEAARRAGCGLLTILADSAAVPIYALASAGHLVRPLEPDGSIPADILADPRVTAMLIGPGAGVEEGTRRRVLAMLGAGKPVVVDADALTAFAGDRPGLLDALDRDDVLTPHEGEFRRLFAETGSKPDRARAAAAAGAVVLLKGADTVVAAPDGRAVINANAPPDLATGGTGDVLAGMILGLRAQGMATLAAAAAAAWMHGAAAAAVGPGLIAEDLAPALRSVLGSLRRLQEQEGEAKKSPLE